MRADRMRIEVLRFTLLVTLTVGLVSVAVRADDDSARTAAHPSATSPATAGPSELGSAGGDQPDGDGGSPASPGAGSGGASDGASGSTPDSTSGGETSGPGSVSGAGSGSPDQSGAAGTPTLPRTGDDQVVILTALALLLLLAGTWCIRLSRRPEG